MKRTLPLFALLAVLPASVALAGDDCRVPQADWQPRQAVLKVAEENGWTVREIDIDDGCYEVEARTREGREIEARLDPKTLQVVEMEYDDDDVRHRPRNPAAATTARPPQNGLFGTGTAPRVQVN
ncbi:MAG: PepSY domain-containing protein [Rhodobacteraceae bacterium]|nr:PepSY domain-containing protein [Paracoccaceae bacterium]MCP5340646.1 PepSY domain-containing protein [Paracoccaceae bacterium]